MAEGDGRGGGEGEEAVVFPQTARHKLVEALLKLSAAETFAGRSTLLHGIQCASSLNRDAGNAYLDFQMIVKKLIDLDKGGQLLHIFVDNAVRPVPGTQLAKSIEEAHVALVRELLGPKPIPEPTPVPEPTPTPEPRPPTFHVAAVAKPVPTRMTRKQALESLNKLLPAQLKELLFTLDVPFQYLPGESAAQASIAVDALRYLEGQGRWGEVEDALLGPPRSPPPTQLPGLRQIQLIIDGDVGELDANVLCERLSRFLNISADSIQTLRLARGSIKLLIALPDDAAARLLNAFARRDPALIAATQAVLPGVKYPTPKPKTPKLKWVLIVALLAAVVATLVVYLFVRAKLQDDVAPQSSSTFTVTAPPSSTLPPSASGFVAAPAPQPAPQPKPIPKPSPNPKPTSPPSPSPTVIPPPPAALTCVPTGEDPNCPSIVDDSHKLSNQQTINNGCKTACKSIARGDAGTRKEPFKVDISVDGKTTPKICTCQCTCTIQ